jgi:PAS domain S-box-containing protein
LPSQWLAVEAGTDLPARARQIQRSWERLLAEGALGPELPPEATAGLRPAIVDSWRRSLATGLDPTDLLPSIEADPSETRARWLEHPLGSFRHVLAEQLQLLAHESNSLVQVTDPSGLTLHLDGPEWLKARAAEMNLVEGAQCAETVNGTNGVGTALAADHPVQVFAFEHFSHHHREWVCSGAPIHDPISGRLVGVLDLSSPWKIAHPRSLEIVTASARTLEQCLLETRRDQDARLTRRYGDLATKSTDLLVNREGYVLIGDSAQPKPFDVPESGGEITMGDGSLAVAEPLGRGEAYLLRRLAPPRARAARAEALERAEGRVREQAAEAALRYGGGQGLAATEGSGGRTSIESDQRVSAYFEAALDCIIIADASGRVVEFNPAAEQTFGYSRDEAVGRTIAELIVPPSLRERHITAFARFIETGHGAMLGRRLELTGMRADGSEFPVELALSKVEGEPALICGALRDISAARKAENHLRELAEEQAALRRVATLVARESSPQELFAVVAEEVARIIDVPLVRLVRYDPDGSGVELIGGWGESVDPLTIGTRWQLEDLGVLASVWHSGRPARLDDYTDAPGRAAAVVREAGMRATVASPITVQARLWGAISVLSPGYEPLPEDTEARLADFTELVATAIANAESRGELASSEVRARALADEQAALRRVATLVAQAPASEELFSAVAREVATVVNVPGVIVTRYEADGMAVVFGEAFESELSGAEAFFGVGSRAPADPGSLAARVLDTHGTARVDDFSTVTGTVGDMACAAGFGSGCAAPIVVNGELWGKLCVFSGTGAVLPARTEERLYDFIELVATAISNYEARAELAASEARALELANEQAALRRVAELVAREATQTEVFTAIAGEIAQLLGTQYIRMARYDGDCAIVVAGTGDRPEMFPVGLRVPLGGDNVTSRVLRTGRPARIDDYRHASGPIADAVRPGGLRGTVAAPIVVGGRLWGAMIVAVLSEKLLPPDTENRLEQFTELMATAIANAEARAEIERLADEQAALRRVATLVAQGAEPGQVFAAVAEEVEQLLDARSTTIRRLEPDGTTVIVASIGTATGIRRTLQVPITVERSHWGSITAGTEREEFPPDAEQRMAEFTELAATAIANAESRSALTASRARVVAASDATRRQIERDLHDGAQQRLVHTVITLKLARRALENGADDAPTRVAEALEQAERATVELRELVQGILPPVLTHSGLRAAVHALADRMPVPVEIRVTEDRMAPAVEATAYFVVAEALTNVAKHSGARHATVDARIEDGFLQIRVRDDGVGGAQPDGHGFVGLGDRLAALNGQLRVESPAGGGTVVAAGIPLPD